MHAAQVLINETTLAHSARTSVAAASTGVLIVAGAGVGVGAGGGRMRRLPVGVVDDGGEPLMSVDAFGPAAPAARRRAHAALRIDPQDSTSVGVLLFGSLVTTQCADTARPHERCARPCASAATGRVTVSMVVQHVVVTCPRQGVPARRSVALEAYALAEPDEFASVAARMMRHLNVDHPRQVRVVAAKCAGVSLDDVIGAKITGLSRQELEVWWTGESGASAQRIRFAEPVRDIADLGTQLRLQLQRR